MKGKVLIVDDEPIIGNLIEGSLTETGFEAEYFNSAAKALENIHRIRPDIVISDIVMPHMDGYELHRRLRQDPETANIPFVFLSTKSEMSDQFRESLRAGTDDYVCKPFKIENLIDRMESVMQRAAAGSVFQPRADFRWDLGQTGLGEIVQIAEINRKSGELIFRNPGGESGGRIFFQKGEMVNAQTDTLDGEEALFTLMEKEEGVFEFHERRVNVSQQITDTNRTVLGKGRHMIEKARTLKAHVPDPDMSLELMSRRIPSDIEKTAGREKLRAILSMIVKGQSVRHILGSGIVSPIRAASVLLALLDSGVATIHGEEEPTAPPSVSPSEESLPPRPPSHVSGEAPPAPSPDSEPSVIDEDFLKVLKSFERSAFTGELEIGNLSAKAVIWFEEGRIVHACHGNTIAKKALFRIFSEHGGSIRLHPGTVSVPRTIEGDLKTLSGEGAEEIGNLARLNDSTFENTVSVNMRALEESSKINGRPGLRHVLSLARRKGRIRDIIETSRMTDFQTYRHLFYLAKMGIFTVEGPSPPGGKVHIVTDSTADLPPEILSDPGITAVRASDAPDIGRAVLGIRGGRGPDVFPERMFKVPKPSLSKGGSVVSAPGDQGAPSVRDVSSANDFFDLFHAIEPDKDILAVFSSGKISRVFEHAVNARERYHSEYPGLSQTSQGSRERRIEILDSRLVSAGLGLIVAEAARKVAEGWPVRRISDHMDRLIPAVRVFFVRDTRAGNPGRMKAMLGHFMAAKEILGIWNGEVVPIDQVRGDRSAKEKLVRWIRRGLEPADMPIRAGITHMNMSEWAEQMRKLLKEELNCRELSVSHVAPSSGAFCGPGTVAVAYFPVPDE